MNIANLFSLMLTNSQLTMAQSKNNNLSSSLSTANLLLALTTDNEAFIQQIMDLTAKLTLLHNLVNKITNLLAM